jgi:hypothetical protein
MYMIRPQPHGPRVPVSDFVSHLSPAAAPSSLALVLVDVSLSHAGDHILARLGLDSAAHEVFDEMCVRQVDALSL